MAQAARLSLRMQKELKLLLSDPPPGATFPYLSSDSDHLSLTAIDAQIEGPKGTVYENGYFHIKIQIPERYPFQPPIVTFATPIYHPNIDTGGRICLDILNLPPKGAWQPSLNISTVITSIGLLLSEPNPDDGLMCEASREYKYNKHAFDQKARSMTEKYAKTLDGSASSSSSSSSKEGFLINSSSSQGGKMALKDEVRSDVSNLKEHAISRKLLLHSSGSTENSNGEGLADQSNSAQHNSKMEIEYKIEAKFDTFHSNTNDGKLFGMRRKLSLEASRQPQKKSHNEEYTLPNVKQSSVPIPQASQQIKGFGDDSDLKCQDVGFDSGEKPPIKKIPADVFNKKQGDHINSSRVQQIIQLTSTGIDPQVPKVSSQKIQAVECGESKSHAEEKNLVTNALSIPRYKQLSNKKPHLGHQKSAEKAIEDNKENIPLVALSRPTSEANFQPCQVSSAGQRVNERLVNSKINLSNQNQGFHRRLSLKPFKSSHANHDSNNEDNTHNNLSGNVINQQVREDPSPPISSEAIVLDSDDDEDKDEPPKLMVARRRLCLSAKRKAKA